jgi:hypothetical protein
MVHYFKVHWFSIGGGSRMGLCLMNVSPLVAAGAPSFLLIEKKQKIKTEKSFPAQAFTHRPRFFVGPALFDRVSGVRLSW